MEVAVILAARPFLGQTVVAQDLEANRGDPLQAGPRHDRVGIDLGPGAAEPDRAIRLLVRRCASGRGKRQGIERYPGDRLGSGRLPGGLPRGKCRANRWVEHRIDFLFSA